MTKGSVIVTGASSGIGKEIALHLVQLGFHVFATVRREADGRALKSVAGPSLTPFLMDVTAPASVRYALAEVQEHLRPPLDRVVGLVNNAGITIAGPLEFVSVESLRRQLEVNLLGHLTVTQTFLPLLRAGRGRIINIGPMVGRVSMPFGGPYSISGYGLEALTEALRMELRPWNIPVSLISTAAVATPLWEKSMADMDRTERQIPPSSRFLYHSALQRVRSYQEELVTCGIAPERVAEAVGNALLARHPKRRYVVGGAAWLAELLHFLPSSLKETLLLRRLGLADLQPVEVGERVPADSLKWNYGSSR